MIKFLKTKIKMLLTNEIKRRKKNQVKTNCRKFNV